MVAWQTVGYLKLIARLLRYKSSKNRFLRVLSITCWAFRSKEEQPAVNGWLDNGRTLKCGQAVVRGINFTR